MPPRRKFFNSRIQNMAARLEGNMLERVKETAIAMVETVVAKTPVDTTLARSNWLVSIDSPRTDVAEIRSAEATVDEARARVAKFKSKNKIYIVNNVEYVKYLNQGSSRQAPAGFVEAAFAAGLARARTGKLLK